MRSMLLAVVFAASAACNAIDGADSYTRGDGGSATCSQGCLDTARTCLDGCASNLASCTAACAGGNPGCVNKCDSSNSNCTTGCVTACTSCNCTQSDCANPPDASAD